MDEKRTTERRKITIREDLLPDIVAEVGHNLFIQDHPEKHAPAVQMSACKALKNFENAISSFPAKTPEGTYCTRLHMLANTLAKGIASKKKECEGKKQDAKDREAEMLSEISQNEKRAGVLMGGLKLLVILGGLGFCAGKLMYTIVGAVQSNGVGMNATWMPIATALGLTLLGSCVVSNSRDKKRREIRQERRDAVERAEQECIEKTEWQYQLALQKAGKAWANLTGEDPPESIIPEKPPSMNRSSQMRVEHQQYADVSAEEI